MFRAFFSNGRVQRPLAAGWTKAEKSEQYPIFNHGSKLTFHCILSSYKCPNFWKNENYLPINGESQDPWLERN